MSDTSVRTTQLHGWIERLRAGDAAAADELVCAVAARLERLTRKMLRDFPGVRLHAQTDDVLQNALMRLLRSLREVSLASMRVFYNLAAGMLRRELLDLARHYARGNRHGAAARGGPGPDESAAPAEAAAPAEPADDLERWTRFHEEVEKLPVEEREVVGLIFYHDWGQAEVAELFGVTVRTVQRRWASALMRLHRLLGESDAFFPDRKGPEARR
jgi:RNA polymerase sigma factor (sigma-70 family)